MRPQRGQFVQLAILRNMRRKWGSVRVRWHLHIIRCSNVLVVSLLGEEQATRATRTAPVAPSWSSSRAWPGPDVIAIAASAAVRARAHILACACADQAHTLKRQTEPFIGSHNSDSLLFGTAKHTTCPGRRLWRHAPNESCRVLLTRRSADRHDQAVCWFDALLGMRLDPGAQGGDGDAARASVAGPGQLAATQHLIDRRTAVAQQPRRFSHFDLKWFESWRRGELCGCERLSHSILLSQFSRLSSL